jgi:hypothetical protein
LPVHIPIGREEIFPAGFSEFLANSRVLDIAGRHP